MAAKSQSKSHPRLVKCPSVTYQGPLRVSGQPYVRGSGLIEETAVAEHPTLAGGEYDNHEVSGFLVYFGLSQTLHKIPGGRAAR